MCYRLQEVQWFEFLHCCLKIEADFDGMMTQAAPDVIAGGQQRQKYGAN